MMEAAAHLGIPTNYGPKQNERYYQRRPGAPLVPIEQAYLEDRQGLDGASMGLRGLGDPSLGAENWSLPFAQGSKPKTEEAFVIQSLKAFGLPNPTKELVDEICKIIDWKEPGSYVKINFLIGSIITEQKIYADSRPGEYQGTVFSNALEAFNRKFDKVSTERKMDVTMAIVIAILLYVLYSMMGQ
jgi:hypothetical protein